MMILIISSLLWSSGALSRTQSGPCNFSLSEWCGRLSPYPWHHWRDTSTVPSCSETFPRPQDQDLLQLPCCSFPTSLWAPTKTLSQKYCWNPPICGFVYLCSCFENCYIFPLHSCYDGSYREDPPTSRLLLLPRASPLEHLPSVRL